MYILKVTISTISLQGNNLFREHGPWPGKHVTELRKMEFLPMK